MVEIGSIILGAVISRGVNDAMDESQESSGESGEKATQAGQQSSDTMEGEKINELIEIEKRNRASANSVDAYAGETLTVPAGGKATVTVTPTKGFDMRVKKVYFDRRSDHTYTHLIGGANLSNNHQLLLQSTRRIRHGGTVVSIVENNSSSQSTVDFELEGWSIPSEE